MPRATPRRSGGNQALTNGTPTANEAPPSPSSRPPSSSAGYEVAKARNSTGAMTANDRAANTIRPP